MRPVQSEVHDVGVGLYEYGILVAYRGGIPLIDDIEHWKVFLMKIILISNHYILCVCFFENIYLYVI